MKRIVRLTESDLKRIAKKVIKEDEDMDYEMSGAAHRRDFKPTPREKQLQGVFGDMYGEDVPPVVIRYMRKNPEKIIQRLYDVYGEKIYDIISDYSQGEMDAPLDEAIEQTIKKTTYTKSDVDQAQQKGIGIDVEDGTVTPTEDGGLVVTSESEDLFADIPMWGGKKSDEEIED
jgi:hypothetical protein